MWNIIRSQLYQLSRDLFMICVLLGLGGIYAIMMFKSLSGASDLNGGSAFVMTGEGLVIILFYMTVLLIPRVCGWDFHDKTINYEILSGHKRAESYVGRVLPGITTLLLLYVLMLGIPVLAGTLRGGWGYHLSAGAALLRSGYMLLVLVRFASEVVCVTFLFKNAYAAMLLCGVVPEILGIILMLVTENERFNILSSLFSMLQLMTFENTRTGFAEGRDITIYITDMDSFFVVAIPALSAAVTLGCLLAGYVSLKKSDLR